MHAVCLTLECDARCLRGGDHWSSEGRIRSFPGMESLQPSIAAVSQTIAVDNRESLSTRGNPCLQRKLHRLSLYLAVSTPFLSDRLFLSVEPRRRPRRHPHRHRRGAREGPGHRLPAHRRARPAATGRSGYHVGARPAGDHHERHHGRGAVFQVRTG